MDIRKQFEQIFTYLYWCLLSPGSGTRLILWYALNCLELKHTFVLVRNSLETFRATLVRNMIPGFYDRSERARMCDGLECFVLSMHQRICI